MKEDRFTNNAGPTIAVGLLETNTVFVLLPLSVGHDTSSHCRTCECYMIMRLQVFVFIYSHSVIIAYILTLLRADN